MLVSEIATRIRRAMSDTNSVEFTDADIIRWINDAQREIVPQLELLQTKAITNPITGTPNYIVPDDLLKMHSVKYKGKSLQQISLEQAEQLFPSKDDATNQATGTPTHFWIWGGELYLYPAPDSAVAGDIACYYNRMPVEVTSTGDTPDIPIIYHNRIVEYCLAQAYELDENVFISELKLNQFSSNLQNMKALSEWESQDTYPYITDTNEYGYGGQL